MEEAFIKRLVASARCTVCGRCYEAGNVSVLGHHEDLWFLRTQCSSCHTQYLVAAVVKERKSPEVISDLTEAEVDKFRGISCLTADDVLDMYDFLKDFDGDFSRLFSRQEV